MSLPMQVIRFRVALFDSDVKPYTVTVDDEHQEEMCAQDPRFIEWLTGWQEAAVRRKLKNAVPVEHL